MSYEAFAARAPADKLDLVLDADDIEMHLSTIADATDEWETILAPHMGLTRMELMDIKRNHRDNCALQRREILRLWKAKFGCEATYGNLMRICLKCGNGRCATVISDLWSESETGTEFTASPAKELNNIGEVLQLKQKTAECEALKRYEDELIQSLRNTDMVALTKRAVGCYLVSNEVLSNIQCLDPSIQWPHPLICRFLFYHVYNTIQRPSSDSKVAKPFEKWLGLLSDLKITAVASVLSRMKQFLSSLQGVLSDRASPSGECDMLNTNDIPLFTAVFTELASLSGEGDLAYSNIPKGLIVFVVTLLLNCEDSTEAIGKVITVWLEEKLSCNTSLAVKRNLIKVMNSDAIGLSQLSLQLHYSKPDDLAACLCANLERYYDKWKIACAVLLLDEADMYMTHVTCLIKLLTLWVSNKFPNALRPTFRNLVQSLGDSAATRLKNDLIKEGCKLSNDVMGDELKIEMVTPSHYTLLEGKAALLEIQVSCASQDPVTFDWLRENAPLSNDDSFCVESTHHGISVGILCIHMKNIMAEGAYCCNVGQEQNFLTSRPMLLSIVTPIDEHKDILTSFYTEQPEVPEDTWPPVTNSYISLALVKQEHISAGEYCRNTIRGDVDDIYNEKESILYGRAFDKLDTGERLLVEGRPGSGKTTLVNKISKDWATEELTFFHNRLLFLVHLRAFSSDPNIGLCDLVKCYYRIDSTVKAIVEYAEKHSGLGLCFILDGLDEYMPKKSNCFIFNLIKKIALPKATVIIATRPAAAAKFRKIATKQVEVIGFLKEQIYDYVKKYKFSDASKYDDLCNYFDQHPNVLHTCYLPIHSAMVCFLFDELSEDLPRTETEIYKEFTKFTIIRILYRCDDDCEEYIESIDELDTSKKNNYAKICKLAYEMTLSSKQVMKHAEIKTFFDIKEEKDSLGLVTVDKMATRLGFQNMYTFLHLTFQEFLAACFISESEEVSQIDLIEKHGKKKQMQQVWKFYCGLVKFSDKGDKFRAVVGNSEYGTLYKVQCCFEAQQPHVCDAAVLDDGLSFTDTFLSASNFSAIAYVVCHSQKNPIETLSFEGCTFGKEEVDVLLNKGGEKLTALSYYRCSNEQMKIVNHFLHSLLSLKFLDISNTYLGKEKIDILLEGLDHTNLEMVKVGSQGSPPCSSVELQQRLARDFNSKFSNFNVLFCGIDEMTHSMKKSLSLPFYFHCSVPCLTVMFTNLSLLAVKALSMEFIINPRYTTITLINYDVNDISAAYLSRGLKCCSHLEVLELPLNYIGDDGAVKISESIKHCNKLTTLDMSYNIFGERGALELAKAVEGINCLKFLFTCSGDITSNVFQTSRDVEFKTLRLSNRDLGDRGASLLAGSMQSSHIYEDIQHLFISKNGISFRGLSPLNNGLVKCSNLLTLDLSCNAIDKHGALVVSEILKQSNTLEKIYISSNFFCNDGAETIAAGLRHCPCLLELKIDSNYIGISGAKALARALKHCTLLQTLGISSNNIKCEGVEALANSMKFWTNFCSLDIRSNSIQSEGAKALADVMEHKPTFKELYIGKNQIQNDGLRHLAMAFESCGTSLSALDISSNGISSDVLEDSSLICVLRIVESFDVSDNDLDLVLGGADCLGNILSNCTTLSNFGVSHIAFVSSCSMSPLPQRVNNNIWKLDISDNIILSDALKDMAAYLKHYVWLQELDISKLLPQGDVTALRAIAGALKCLPHLRILGTSYNHIESDGMQLLSSSLSHCRDLYKLLLDNNLIGDNGANAVAAIIRHCRKLRVLNVASNSIGIKGTKVLANALKEHKNIHEFDISDNNIAGEADLWLALEHLTVIRHLKYSGSSTSLYSSLKNCRNLEILHINSSVVTKFLSYGLMYCQNLQELYIKSSIYSSFDGTLLADTLIEYCRKIRVLDISFNQLGCDAMTKVLCCPNLEDLNISGCIPHGNVPSSYDLVFQSLRNCTKLRSLNISNNMLNDSDIEVLASGLEHCRILVHLYIKYNNFGIRGVRTLANVLKHCTMLYTLDLSGNKIYNIEFAYRTLAEVLQGNITLGTLGVNDCGINAEGASILAEALPCLSSLDFEQ